MPLLEVSDGSSNDFEDPIVLGLVVTKPTDDIVAGFEDATDLPVLRDV